MQLFEELNKFLVNTKIDNSIIPCSSFSWVSDASPTVNCNRYFICHNAFKNIHETSFACYNIAMIKIVILDQSKSNDPKHSMNELIMVLNALNERQQISTGVIVHENSFLVVQMAKQCIHRMEEYNQQIYESSHILMKLMEEMKEKNSLIYLYDLFFEKLKVTNEDLQIYNILGEGTFGKVFHGYCSFHQTSFAVKTMLVDSSHFMYEPATLQDLFKNEILTLTKCSDFNIENVVRIQRIHSLDHLSVSYRDQLLMGYIMEEVGRPLPQELTPEHRLILLRELLRLHQQHIIHGDARPSNMLEFGNSPQFIIYKWIDLSHHCEFSVSYALEDLRILLVSTYHIIESYIPLEIFDHYQILLCSTNLLENEQCMMVDHIHKACEELSASSI